MELSEEQRALVSAVRDFTRREVLPVASELEHADAYPADLVERMRELGLFGATIPEEYGGGGAGAATYALLIEELAKGWMSLAGVLNTHLLVAHMIAVDGTAEQRERFLPAMARGRAAGGALHHGAGRGNGRRGDPDARRPRRRRVRRQRAKAVRHERPRRRNLRHRLQDGRGGGAAPSGRQFAAWREGAWAGRPARHSETGLPRRRDVRGRARGLPDARDESAGRRRGAGVSSRDGRAGVGARQRGGAGGGSRAGGVGGGGAVRPRSGGHSASR